MTDGPARKPVSKRLRFEVFRRDGFRCRYCGTPASESGEGLTVDHVVPVSLGGANEPANLVTACKDCNAGKSSSSPDDATVAQVADDALRWARAIKVAAEEAQADFRQHEVTVRAFAKHWKAESGPTLPGGWRDTIRDFCSRGMSKDDLLRYADMAINRTNRLERGPDDVFSYFCGIGWNVVRERQRRAAEILATTEAASPALHPGAVLVDGAETYPLYNIGNWLHTIGVGRSDAGSVAALAADLVGDLARTEIGAGWHEWLDGGPEPDITCDIEAILGSWGGAIRDTWVDV